MRPVAPRGRSTPLLIGVSLAVGLIIGLVLGLAIGSHRGPAGGLVAQATASAVPSATGTPTATPTVEPGVAATLTAVANAVLAPSATPSPPPSPTETPTRLPTATLTPTPLPSPTPAPPTATPTATPTPQPTPTPTPTRGPLRITKLGLGVYGSGGAFNADLANWRPSVILLMDPTVDFAESVRKSFPKAFIIGRRYVPNQPLDNPAARGTAFADYVVQLAVPLKGVVNAWMSYNEVTGYTSATDNNYAAWNTFQVAFAQRLQGTYGIDAVAGNDGPGAVAMADYVTYFAGAISTSHYFGVHAYPPPDVHSMQQGAGPAAMLHYRAIHDALAKAGITSGPFILTETGLFHGWRGVESEQEMAADYIWLTGELAKDPYVIGQTAFGLFDPNNDQWRAFNVASTSIGTIVGDYNSCEPSHPCPPGQQG